MTRTIAGGILTRNCRLSICGAVISFGRAFRSFFSGLESGLSIGCLEVNRTHHVWPHWLLGNRTAAVISMFPIDLGRVPVGQECRRKKGSLGYLTFIISLHFLTWMAFFEILNESQIVPVSQSHLFKSRVSPSLHLFRWLLTKTESVSISRMTVERNKSSCHEIQCCSDSCYPSSQALATRVKRNKEEMQRKYRSRFERELRNLVRYDLSNNRLRSPKRRCQLADRWSLAVSQRTDERIHGNTDAGHDGCTRCYFIAFTNCELGSS
jgi:hypothetical protein